MCSFTLKRIETHSKPGRIRTKHDTGTAGKAELMLQNDKNRIALYGNGPFVPCTGVVDVGQP